MNNEKNKRVRIGEVKVEETKIEEVNNQVENSQEDLQDVTESYYDENGELNQRGLYILVDGNLRAHGTWKDSFGTTAYFDTGRLVWIKPNGQRKYTNQEIELHRLRNKVKRLEESLTSL